MSLDTCNCESELLACDAPYTYEACLECYDDGTGACNGSPILVDVTGNGFSLTDPLGGVDFDLDGDGRVERIAWTSAVPKTLGLRATVTWATRTKILRCDHSVAEVIPLI